MIRPPFLLLLVSIALVAPAALAHVPSHYPVGIAGTPKHYCEDVPREGVFQDERRVHEYGPPTTGFTLFLPTDGSLEYCPYNAGTDMVGDGHLEWAQGGAYLVAGRDPVKATTCGWPYPDHPAFPTVAVYDLVLTLMPADVGFFVFADTLNNIPPLDPNEPNCGDLEADFGVSCVNNCGVGFPPGLDQTYVVYVNGVQGHIVTS